jgi:exonuclease SbcC
VPEIEGAISVSEAALKSSQDALQLVAGLNTEDKITSYTTAIGREPDLRSSLRSAKSELAAAESACDRAKGLLGDAKRDYESAVERAADETSSAVSAQKAELDSINDEIDAIGKERGNRQADMARHESERDALVAGQADSKELRKQWRVYETLLSAYSKKGLPSQILDKLLPAINAEISEILSGVVNFEVQLEIDAETNSLEIYIDYGDSRRIVELGSGMEKMIASIAIRVALTRITTLPKPDFIIIDEGFGTLDESQLTACVALIRSLKRIYRFILVISHVDAVKDAVDQVIEITRVNGASQVTA